MSIEIDVMYPPLPGQPMAIEQRHYSIVNQGQLWALPGQDGMYFDPVCVKPSDVARLAPAMEFTGLCRYRVRWTAQDGRITSRFFEHRRDDGLERCIAKAMVAAS